jgi:hypothetical protein
VVVKRIFVRGIGAVSPAGWNVEQMRQALNEDTPLPSTPLNRPGWNQPLIVRRVGAAGQDPRWASHARLRRTSPISSFGAAAATEALGSDLDSVRNGQKRLGVLFCVTGGCVQFTRRFYDEAWRNPAMASPLVFPETVFNAPSSHLSALMLSPALNYTLVGDPGTFLQAIGIGAGWLLDGQVDACLIVGAEEMDWLTADALRHFSRQTICSEGAGALYLSATPPTNDSGIELIAITDSYLYWNEPSRMQAIDKMQTSLKSCCADATLCDSTLGLAKRDACETAAWSHWNGPRLSPKRILGEGLMAGAAWQCVAAIDSINKKQPSTALVSVAGIHQQAIGACFASVK